MIIWINLNIFHFFRTRLRLTANAPENTVVSLGINDEVDEGSFVEFDGTPMKFHSFAERQPNNRVRNTTRNIFVISNLAQKIIAI